MLKTFTEHLHEDATVIIRFKNKRDYIQLTSKDEIDEITITAFESVTEKNT